MKDQLKNLFPQYFQKLSVILMKTRSSMSEEYFNNVNDFKPYEIEIHGPYIICSSHDNSGSINRYVLFTLHYSFRVANNQALIMNAIPLNSATRKAFSLIFESNDVLNRFMVLIHQSRFAFLSLLSIVKNDSQSDILIPIVIEANMKFAEKKFNKITPMPQEIVLMLDDRNTHTIPYKYITDIDLSFSKSTTPNEYTFIICSKMNPNLIITCQSKDQYLYLLTFINLTLVKNSEEDTKKPCSDEIFALDPSSRAHSSPEIQFTFQSTSFLSRESMKMSNNYNNRYILPAFRPLTIPQKASSMLELLSFGNPIYRRIFALKKRIRKSQTKANIGVSQYIDFSFDNSKCFSNELNSIKSLMKDDLSIQSFKSNKQTKHPFSYLNPSITIFFNSSTELLSSSESVTVSQCVADLAADLGLKTDPIRQILYGSSTIQLVSKKIMALPIKVQYSDESFVDLCLLFSSILSDLTPSEKFVDKLPELILKDKALLSCITSNSPTPFSSIVIFVARLLMHHRLCSFLSLLLHNNEWRSNVYRYPSLMRYSSFLCDLEAVCYPLNQIKFTGYLNPQLYYHRLPYPSLESNELRIKAACESVLSLERNNSSLSEYIPVIGLIISSIIDYFSLGFQSPFCAIIPQMRSCWYAFAAATDLDSKVAEMVPYKAAVKKASLLMTEDPNEVLANLLFLGLGNGLAWAYVMFAAIKGKKDDLYTNESGVLQNEKILMIADALSILRNTSISIEFEEIWRHIDQKI